MRHRMVSDLMTTSVVRVREYTGFKDIAETAGRVRHHGDTRRGRRRLLWAWCPRRICCARRRVSWTPQDCCRRHPRPADRTKQEATTARGLMNSPAITARPQWTVVEAAQVMERHRVKRLPVVDEADRLVGLMEPRRPAARVPAR